MGILQSLKGEQRPTVDDNPVELRSNLANLYVERDAALDESGRIPTEIDTAILAGDEARVEKLEAGLLANRRALRKFELSLPILERRLLEADLAERDRQVAHHRAQAAGHFEKVNAAVEKLMAANDAATRHRREACAEMGTDIALAYVPAAAFHAIAHSENVDRWREDVNIGLGRTKRPAPIVRGVAVDVLQTVPNMRLNAGETVSVDEGVAQDLVNAGVAMFSAGTKVLRRVPPHQAPAPKPDERGRIPVVAVRASTSCAHPFAPGDLLSFPAETAITFVRTGYAEFVPNERPA